MQNAMMSVWFRQNQNIQRLMLMYISDQYRNWRRERGNHSGITHYLPASSATRSAVPPSGMEEWRESARSTIAEITVGFAPFIATAYGWTRARCGIAQHTER